MNKYLIDTSILINYFAEAPEKEIVDIIENEESAVSIMAIAEFSDKAERENKNIKKEIEFIKSKLRIMPLSINICTEAAKIKNQARITNSKFSLVDGIHLATSIEENLILVTADKDFNGIEDVKIIQ